MGALIWLASYPKSGNTWMRSFLHNLFRNEPRPVPINEITDFCLGEAASGWYKRFAPKALENKDFAELARMRPHAHRAFTQVYPDSVFVKTHNYLGEWHGYPLHNMDVTAGGIYILRNPLDVAISMTHHYGQSMDEAIERLADLGSSTGITDTHIPEIHSSWSNHVRSWTRKPNPQLLVLRYEDLLDKPRKHFKQVASFLGLNPPRERLERAIRFSSFKALKAQESSGGFKEKSKYADAFFRTGEKGQWRKVLTDAQVRRIIADHGEQMLRFNYVPADYWDALPEGLRTKEIPATPQKDAATRRRA